MVGGLQVWCCVWCLRVYTWGTHLHGRGENKRIATHGRITVFFDAVLQRRGGCLFCAGMVGESPGLGSHCCVVVQWNRTWRVCGRIISMLSNVYGRREVEMDCCLPGTSDRRYPKRVPTKYSCGCSDAVLMVLTSIPSQLPAIQSLFEHE